ncbi:hypothetical protein PQR33_21690 [Paraburkholderia sediminicola]
MSGGIRGSLRVIVGMTVDTQVVAGHGVSKSLRVAMGSIDC